jgi:hypothetical protein
MVRRSSGAACWNNRINRRPCRRPHNDLFYSDKFNKSMSKLTGAFCLIL